jgi:hypothetical protein
VPAVEPARVPSRWGRSHVRVRTVREPAATHRPLTERRAAAAKLGVLNDGGTDEFELVPLDEASAPPSDRNRHGEIDWHEYLWGKGPM